MRRGEVWLGKADEAGRCAARRGTAWRGKAI